VEDIEIQPATCGLLELITVTLKHNAMEYI
jgi:hypothetical protein